MFIISFLMRTIVLDLVYTTLEMHLSRRVACHAVISSHSIGYVPRRKTFFFVFLKCRKLLEHGCFCRCERDVLRLSRVAQYGTVLRYFELDASSNLGVDMYFR